MLIIPLTLITFINYVNMNDEYLFFSYVEYKITILIIHLTILI